MAVLASLIIVSFAFLALLSYHGANSHSSPYMYPAGCSGDSCDYTAEWMVSHDGFSVTFKIRSKVGKDRWVAIGWGMESMMKDLDVVYAFYDSQDNPVIEDAFAHGFYQPPQPDSQQDLTDTSLVSEGEFLQLTFTRARDTGDTTDDHQFGDTAELFFMFPVGGGPHTDTTIIKHSQRPMISEEKILVVYEEPHTPPTNITSMNTTTPSLPPMNITAPRNTTTTLPMPGHNTTTMPMPGNTTTTMPMPGNTTTPSVSPGATPTTTPSMSPNMTTSTMTTTTTTTDGGGHSPTIPNTPPAFQCPADCTPPDCAYTLHWTLNEVTDEVTFYVRSRVGRDRWVGVGWGEEKANKNLDVVIGFFDSNGQVHVFDGFVTELAVPPTVDPQQDVTDYTLVQNGEFLELIFTRKRNTGDTENDHHFGDTPDHYLTFPVGGGPHDDEGIQPPTVEPEISEEKICICSSILVGGNTTMSTTTHPGGGDTTTTTSGGGGGTTTTPGEHGTGGPDGEGGPISTEVAGAISFLAVFFFLVIIIICVSMVSRDRM